MRILAAATCSSSPPRSAASVLFTTSTAPDGTFEEVPEVESERDAHTILGWALEPGDAVAFNMLTLHAAAGSRNRRRAFSVRLVGGDVRLAVRPHPTSPPFPELDDVLGHGEPLDHPLFPRVWPRDAVA
jgi:ectoine hydroxylase-related dioxygenase (phytanoyl-CoA dioxygenase family)